MSLRSIPKGLFNTRKEEPKPQLVSELPRKGDRLPPYDSITIQTFGYNSASHINGTSLGLSICLNRIYQDHKNDIARDTAKQNELKQPYRLKLHELKAENESINQRNERMKLDDMSVFNNKIEKLKREIVEIRSSPEQVSGDKSGKASFYAGLIILILLTVYLFIFYSSASYSSFFREFQISEIGIVKSIFDAQALSKAYKEGFTELILLITIPAVFLGLGFLIHKGSEKRGSGKYLFIGSLIFVTFIFDTIIAYEICEKIYNIQKENSFKTGIPDYSLGLAFQSVNFWLIIFAGFVVYIIWGLVFDFTIVAYEKLDKVRVAILNKEEEIKNVEASVEKLNAEINENKEKVVKNIAEINKLKDLIENKDIIPSEFRSYLYQFMQGWLQWMTANLKSQEQQQECQEVLSLFEKTNLNNSEIINL